MYVFCVTIRGDSNDYSQHTLHTEQKRNFTPDVLLPVREKYISVYHACTVLHVLLEIWVILLYNW